MHLNIFTNCTTSSPDISLIKRTYESFVDTFGKIPMTIYADPNPQKENFEKYVENLRVFNCKIVKTDGLADGYLKSIENSNDDYLFQLEHDWTFQNITHSLKEIEEVMSHENIYHFRFNKHENNQFDWLKKWQKYITEKSYNGFKYCETDNMSNNPHIIDRRRYPKDLIKHKTGSFGIEECLKGQNLISCVYGGIGLLPTIAHSKQLTNKIKAYFLNDLNNNCGDTLTKPILEYLGYEVQLVDRNVKGKFLGVGSVMSALRRHDIVWGTGCIRDKEIIAPPCRFLAVRGPLTRGLIKNSQVPEVYGDPALLLPIFYNPKVKVIHEVGVIPHYIDKQLVKLKKGEHFIDIQTDWQNVVREIKSCKKIISSSLHGIIMAEAYGVPAVWVKYSDNIIGGRFKFDDYFLGTGREKQKYNKEIEPIKDLKGIQARLIQAINANS